MAVSILITTSNAGFGELVSQILLETGDYDLAIAGNKVDTLTALENNSPGLLILETDLPDESIEEIVSEARALVSDLRIILIIAEGMSAEDYEKQLSPGGMLTKPVYLPDLVTKVEEVIEEGDFSRDETSPTSVSVAVEVDDQSPPPQWLSDVNLAAQYLTSLSLESAAQAALITNLDQIWAYAGELPQLAAEELARIVSQQFQNGGGSDLARFISLEQTGSEYMLYATGLGGPFVLSTVFDAEMPFSKIRAQASNLAMALASPPPEEVIESPQHFEEDEDLFDEAEELELWPLLADIPPPIPDVEPGPLAEQKESSLLDELMENSIPDEFSSDTMVVSGRYYSQEPESEPEPEPELEDDPEPEQVYVDEPDLAETAASAARQQEEEATAEVDVEEMPPMLEDDIDDLSTPEEEIEVEPVSPSVYNLTYACVLIPRFPEHQLTGDVEDRLTDWITHLCVAFGWRLENLSIDPEFVQLMVNVPPNTSPGYLMRTIREHTSRRMFVEFPTMEQDNPAGDFWAPGYLVLGTPQPPPPKLIEEFMENTRSRQGLQE